MKYLKLYENIKNLDPFDEEDWDEIDINPLEYTKKEFLTHFINIFNDFLNNYQNHDHLLNVIYKGKVIEVFIFNNITVKIIGTSMSRTIHRGKSYIYNVYIKDKYNNYEYKEIYLFSKYYNDIKKIWNFIRKKGNKFFWY